MEIALVLAILLIGLVLFATGWVRMDLVSLMILVSLAVSGLVPIEEAFSGFSNPAVITVVAMFVIGAGISNTGATARVGERLLRVAGAGEGRLAAGIMVISGVLSSFINNIGAVAVLLPVVMTLARKTRISPSKLLIPLAYGSLLGGMCTLIGTPPNILMNALLQQYAGERFRMFDFLPVGGLFLLLGVAYVGTVGHRLLPRRKAGNLTEAYQVKRYVTEVEVLEGSPVAGSTISRSSLESDFGLKVQALVRGGRKYPFPRRNRKIRVGDLLLVEGSTESILKLRQRKGLAVVPERDNPVRPGVGDPELVVVEATLTPVSELAGKTLGEVRFADTYGLAALAIWRRGTPLVKRVDQVELAFGDVLLLQGPEASVVRLGRERGVLLLGDIPAVTYQPRKAPYALAVLAAVVTLAATGVLPIVLSATLGALFMVLGRCLTPMEAYESVDWSIVILIAGTLPLGLAMEKSGAAHLLAEFLIGGLGPLGPWAVLAGVYLLTLLLTEIMSHSAAAVLVAPIAFSVSQDMGVHPKAFFLAVAVAASSCFMTPIGHQSNALVMGPGGYRFLDYTRVGVPLDIIGWIVAVALIPLIFPF
jgi:di/tricarboxylate transporter